ncbi:MAG: ABC transporter substrate-binding protein [Clostridia bacterium]|nr:ABC transporter substrate-binding protein [Clostridia bacterium]
MKRLLALFISIILTFSITACSSKGEVNLYIVDGAPTLAVAKIINDKEINGKKVNVKTVSSVDVLNSAILNGSADVVVMPVNSAQKLYNNGVKIKLLTVNVFGCLYIVGKGEISSLTDFNGKEINLVGKTGTPDLSIKFLLNKKGITYSENDTSGVQLKYIQNDTVIPSLKTNAIDYALIGEPLVSKAIDKVENLKPLIDIKKEWESITNGKLYTQAGVVVTDKLIESDFNFVKGLYSSLTENKQFIYNNATTLNSVFSETSALKTLNFNEEILNRCNVGCERASEIDSDIEFYLKTLNEEYNGEFIYKGKL